MADIIPLHAPPTPKADIDPRFRGIGDRLVAAGFEIVALKIGRDFGALAVEFADVESARLFAALALTGDYDARILKSQYDSYCRICGKGTLGDEIYWCPSDRPEPIRKYRRAAKKPAARAREAWVDKAWVCHVDCLPVAATWVLYGCQVRVRAQDLTWLEYRLENLPMGLVRMRGSEDDYQITSDPPEQPRPQPPPCRYCGQPIVGRRKGAWYCCREHQLKARPSTAKERRHLRSLWAQIRAMTGLANGIG